MFISFCSFAFHLIHYVIVILFLFIPFLYCILRFGLVQFLFIILFNYIFFSFASFASPVSYLSLPSLVWLSILLSSWFLFPLLILFLYLPFSFLFLSILLLFLPLPWITIHHSILCPLLLFALVSPHLHLRISSHSFLAFLSFLSSSHIYPSLSPRSPSFSFIFFHPSSSFLPYWSKA